MAKADLGTKRLCPNCGARYYDLDRVPVICPRCGTEFVLPTSRARPQAAVPVKEVEVEEVAVEGAEIVSPEEGDAEVAGGAEEEEEAEELEVAPEAGEDVFLEPEEGEEDVAGIIGDVDEEER